VASASPIGKLALIVALVLVVLAAWTIAPPNHSFVVKITDSMCPQDDHAKLRRAPTGRWLYQGLRPHVRSLVRAVQRQDFIPTE
jgi:hypothetical protein